MPEGDPPMWSSLRNYQPTWTGRARMCVASSGRRRCPRTTLPSWTCTARLWGEQLPRQLHRQPPLPASLPLVTEPASPSAACPRLPPPPCAPARQASRYISLMLLACCARASFCFDWVSLPANPRLVTQHIDFQRGFFPSWPCLAGQEGECLWVCSKSGNIL